MCEDAFENGGLYEPTTYKNLGLSVDEKNHGSEARVMYVKKYPTFQDYKQSKQ